MDFISKTLYQIPELNYTQFLEVCLAVLNLDTVPELDADTFRHYESAFMNLLLFFGQGFYDDILGQIHQELIGKIEAQRTGQFYTPMAVAILMAELSDVTPEGTVHDPAIGGGVTLLAARYVVHKKYGWRRSSGMKLSGQDISYRATLISKIHLRLTDYYFLRRYLYNTIVGVDQSWQKKYTRILMALDFDPSVGYFRRDVN